MYKFYVSNFLFLSFFYACQGCKCRKGRTCSHKPCSALEPFCRKSIFENVIYLVLIILLGILFGLILLGFIKALLGALGFHRIGQWGMEMLIDLPKPLNRYQERELKNRTVCYDIAGWPVHPDTGERTVRWLPLRTEFCLNTIFFLAYPLALILKLCSICCCIKDYNGEDETCCRQVNIIKCNKHLDKKKSGQELDMYEENDLREAKDTNYVINCMKQSHMSLEKLYNSFN